MHDSTQSRGRSGKHDYIETRIISAISIIIVGIILLLNSTGVLSWGVWLEILKFWPLFIVSAGVGIMFNGSRIPKFIGSVITFVIFIVVVGLAIFRPLNQSWVTFPLNPNIQAQDSSHTIRASEYIGVETKSLSAEIAIGDFELEDSDSVDYLQATEKFYNDGEKLTFDQELENGNLSIDIKTSDNNNFFNTQGPEYDIAVGKTSIPSDFSLKFGAGNGVVDLSDQKVKSFNAEVGAGNLEITFSEDSIPSESLHLRSGVGNIKLTVPRNVGVTLFSKVGLGSLTFDGKKVTAGAGDTTFTSENFDSADVKVEINVEIGLGNVEIFRD